MNTMYESLMNSINHELSDIEKYGRPQGRKTILSCKPIKEYSATEIKALRNKLGVSQPMFAKCVGVSKKAVEKWENGTNNPSGPVLRMFDLFDRNIISINDYIKQEED